MKILLVHLESDQRLGAEWHRLFDESPDVQVLAGDICHVDADAVVSPANSFGFMDGGLDYALSMRFGWGVQSRLKQAIQSRPLGELLVGEALIIPTGDGRVPWLISAPTMRVPMDIRGTVNAYLAMKAILSAVRDHEDLPSIESVAIPGLGTGCGRLSPIVAARQMWMAYREVFLGHPFVPANLGGAITMHSALMDAERSEA
ncbi:MAG: macro domain-containing protein [Sphingomonadaceae bacterium]